MVKESYVKLVVELDDEHKIWEDCGCKTITIISYLKVFLEIDGLKIDMDIRNLMPLIIHLNLFKYFKEKSLEEITKLQNYFISFKDDKGRMIKDSNGMYYKDINISYYQDGYYSIVLTNENSRNKLVDIWKDYLEEIENGKEK